jgi:DNA replication and repair protein RecF
VRPLRLEALSIRAFRNLDSVDLSPSPRFNVVSGENGQGKTNLLEAIYVLATSKSFRASKPGDVVRHEAEIASVRARVSEEDEAREQSVGLKAGARLARIDGKRPPSLAAYARRTPVVVFHPGEVSLSMGAGSERRKLLDRLSLYLRASALDDLERYQRAMRERQRALETRGTSASGLGEWEELMVRHGEVVMEARAEVAERLALATVDSFAQIASPGLSLAVAYAPGAPRDPVEFRQGLAAARSSDLRRGGAGVGPHRDDVSLRLDGRPMRGVASQGQHRAAVLALKAAEIAVIGEARGARPILLLDDVSSELDRARTAALFAFLQGQHGQVFLTTTRPELIALGESERTDFHVVRGVVGPGRGPQPG